MTTDETKEALFNAISMAENGFSAMQDIMASLGLETEYQGWKETNSAAVYGKPKKPNPPKLALSGSEAAAAIGVSAPTMANLYHTKGFPVFNVGSRKIIPVDGLRAWLDEQAQAGSQL